MALSYNITSLQQSARRSKITNLPDRQVILDLQWVGRSSGTGAAYLSLFEIDGTPIAGNVRLSSGPLPVILDTGRGTNEGAMYVGGPDPYAKGNIGEDVILLYLSTEERESLVAPIGENFEYTVSLVS